MPKKKKFENIKDIEEFVNKVRKYFFIEQYEIAYTKIEKDDDSKLATIGTRHDYLDADISIYPLFWKESSKQQKATVIHELCHIITSVQANRMWELIKGRHMTLVEYMELWEKENNWMERIMRKLLADKVDLT